MLAIVAVGSAEIGRHLMFELLRLCYMTPVTPKLVLNASTTESCDILLTSPVELLNLIESDSPYIDNVTHIIHYDSIKRPSMEKTLDRIFHHHSQSGFLMGTGLLKTTKLKR